MTAKVISLQIKPGIQRDGTQFDAPCFTDGRWVRFQRGRPRKMGGYRGMFLNATEISRGMIMNSENGQNYLYSGSQSYLQMWQTDNNNGIGTGPINIGFNGEILTLGTLVAGSGYTNGTYTAVPLYGGSGLNAVATIVVAGNVVTTVTLTAGGENYTAGDVLTTSNTNIGGTGSGFSINAATVVNGGAILTLNTLVAGSGYTNGTYTLVPLSGGSGSGAVATVVVAGTVVTTVTLTSSGNNYIVGNVLTTNNSNIGGTGSGFSIKVATIVNGFTANANNLWQFDIGYDAGNGGLSSLVAHPGLNLTNIDNTTNTPVFSGTFPGSGLVALTDSQGSTPTGDPIQVSGGCVLLHPYLFVYGNDGLIKNCSAGNFFDWNSADANETNVSTGKIVKGLPVRGGTTSPSGLFWSLDSLVRVSYSPSTVGASTIFWRYDIISQQTSIMSSSCVIEYDGIYFWCGVDRFLMYNGVVQEIPNQMNMNYFFDNLNYNQRQKVWVSKVPRWGEIWWFYPRGDSTECNDAIVFNIREQVWYDAGTALGVRRSAGVFSEVFRKPVWAGTEENTVGTYTLWQHETGVNEIYLNNENAIESYFETNNIGWVTGGPGAEDPVGPNRWIRLERVEPDFRQSEQMNLYVTGKGYANDVNDTSDPYIFTPDTLKIDMREQRREMRLKFESNIVNGNYETGQILLSADFGDERSTGNP